MLISFSIRNWKSYRDVANLSMMATREQQHKETLREVSSLRAKLLSVAAIFGKNAAGKSNLFQALSFSKWFITRSTHTPTSLIPITPFRFDSVARDLPVEFSFSLLIENVKWEYSFAVTAKRVIRESLECAAKKKGRTSYTRTYNAEADNYSMEYGSALERDRQLLDLIAQTTRPNQLFLTTSVYQNTKYFSPVFQWFDSALQLISPKDTFTRLDLFTNHAQPSSDDFNAKLKEFQTGITKIELKKIDLARIPIPLPDVESLCREIPEGKPVRLNINGKSSPFLLTKKDGALTAEKLVSVHKLNGSQEDVDLPLQEESDGTRRIIDLLPVLINLETRTDGYVCVIDELDRCLHSSATQKFLELFRKSREVNKNSQLLFTTHDLQLMNQAILRRDEIWVAFRDMEMEASKIRRFSEIANLRKDKTLLNSYLSGSFEAALQESSMDN